MTYAELIALSYFKECGEDYDLGSLRKIIGANELQFHEIIEKLFEDGTLEYSGTLLRISDKGAVALCSHNMLDYCGRIGPVPTICSNDPEEVVFPSRFLESLG